jgi:hypothetical protein
MNRLSLNIARCALAAWIAAAAMFVITSVREVTSPEFSSSVRSHLALLRFPIYYKFGFTLVPIAIIAVLIAWTRAGKVMPSLRWVMGLLLLALALMIVDYAGIYSPMVEMLAAESTGQARPSNFITYHRASETVNSLGVLLCFAALITLCTPMVDRSADS